MRMPSFQSRGEFDAFTASCLKSFHYFSQQGKTSGSVCRAITDKLPEENLNSLVIDPAFRRGLLQNYPNFQRAINP